VKINMARICEVCGHVNENAEEAHDLYDVCENCMFDRDIHTIE
jgi:hypothetical protein